MSDRHEKWTPVEPGTVIPAGQPYRIEQPIRHRGCSAWEQTSVQDYIVGGEAGPVFVDSSWKPPLVLPTEPTWGIGIFRSDSRKKLGLWERTTTGSIIFADRSHVWGPQDVPDVLDFIPLTDEQVTRIEAAR